MKPVAAYQCDYCGQINRDRKQSRAHERRCYYNPASRSCVTCGNFCRYDEEQFTSQFGEVIGCVCTYWYCLFSKASLDRRATNCEGWREITPEDIAREEE